MRRKRSRDRLQGPPQSSEVDFTSGDSSEDCLINENKLVADTNYDLLVEAVRNGDVTTLKKMFQDNLDVSVLMFEVASRENPDVLDALLQPEQDNLDSTRILKAVKYNRVDSMRSLLGAGVEPSGTEEFGHTIIQYAIIHNTLESLLKALNISTKECNKSTTYKIVDEKTSLYSKDGYESDFSEIESNCTVRVNLKKYILQTNKEGRNAFHTASSMGDLNILKLLYSTCDGDVDLDVMDNAGHTPLSMAIRGGYSNCVKFLIKNGSDLSMRFKSGVSAIQLLLKECPKGYEIMDKVLDFCAKEDGKIDFSMLFSDKAETQLDIVFLMFRYARRDQWGILSHPIVECLIALKWALVAPLFWMRFIAYIVARTMEADKPVTGMLRIPILFFASLVVALSMFFVSSTPKHLIHRTGVSILRLLPPVLAIVYVLLDDGESKWPQQIGSFAILFCWLGLLMNLDIYPTLSHQAYMFLEICYGMFKYVLIFACVSVAFTLSFFVIFFDKHHFRNPWRAFLYTNMVLLQGGFSNVRLFDTEMHMDVTDSIVIGILSLLFLIVTIIGVLNMLVGLAVRGSQELEIDGHIIYQKHKVETLYGLEKFVLNKYFKIYSQAVIGSMRRKKSRDRLQEPPQDSGINFNAGESSNDGLVNENKLVADTNYDLLVEAVRNGDVTTLKKMFQDNLDVSVLMFEVASRENLDVLDALLQPEQDNLDSTRILKAVKYNRVNSMKSLLEAGVEPSTTEEFGHTIIQYAIIHNTLESLLKALIISPNDNNNISSFKIPDETTSLYSKDGYESDSGEIYFGSKLKDNLKKYIMQTNKEGRNAFHTAALMGDLNSLKLLYLTCDGDVDLDVMDNAGQTPLSMAIRAGYYKCVKLLIKNGSDLSMRFKSGMSAIQLLLKECPKGYEIMDKVLDFCAKEDGKIDFSMLFSDKAETQLDIVFLMFRYARRDQWGILSHPILECLIALKWALVAPLFWMRFIAYIVFTGFITSYTVARTMEADKQVIGMLKILTCTFASLVVALSMFFISSTPKHLIHRTGVFLLRLLPSVLAIVYVLLDDGVSRWPQQIGSFAILFCWLALLMNLDIYPALSHQAYMFLEICYGMFNVAVRTGQNDKNLADRQATGPLMDERIINKLQATLNDRHVWELEFTQLPHTQINTQVIFLNDCIGPEVEDECRQSPQGSLILLENLYFFPEENPGNNLVGSNKILKKVGTITSQYALRRLADVFINDSFSTSYLLNSSMLGNAFEVRAAGLVLEKELEYFQRALHDPQRPYLVIFGGAKLMEKMKIIEHMLPLVDEMIIGGSLAFTFLKVLKGMQIGDSVYCEKTAPLLKDFIQRAIALKVTVHLPVDFYIAKNPVTNNSEAKLVHVADGIPKEWIGADIGETTLKLFKDVVRRANFIVWNGPMGIYEYSLFTKGSQGILDIVGETTKNNHAITILSGEETAACASLWGGENKVSHVSTGGLASVKILAGEALPGVVTLRRPFSHLKANLCLYD
uniref:Phosphoglycerate kinase n=1 Tax=Timema monikensis TaxID=170555 RepID=A0A7R9HLW6_9NEOP|nr:unnamed protein product [Timema monikensis]